MDGIGQLFSFIGSLGDELSKILEGEGKAPPGEWELPDEFAEEDSGDEAEEDDTRIRPVVINGPSGVGKGTMISLLVKEYPTAFGFSVSHTTRAPRVNEQNAVNYYFTTKEVMLAMIEKGEFLESAEVHGNLYGTSFAAVEAVAQRGQVCVLDIDVQGTQSVKNAKLDPEPTFIFIKPPSMEVLETRLRSRGTETEEKIQKRLATAVGEMTYGETDDGANYDHILTNGQGEEALAECFAELKTIVQPHLKAVAA